MPNKYYCGLTRAEKIRILAQKILDHFNENGTPVTLENFADYSDLLANVYGMDASLGVYNLLLADVKA